MSTRLYVQQEKAEDREIGFPRMQIDFACWMDSLDIELSWEGQEWIRYEVEVTPEVRKKITDYINSLRSPDEENPDFARWTNQEVVDDLNDLLSCPPIHKEAGTTADSEGFWSFEWA